jgi:hypothetical protein
MLLKRTALTLSLFSALAFPGYAMAQDVPPAVQAILDSWEAQLSVKPTYKNLSVDGDNATIEGLEAMVSPEPGKPDGVKITVEKIALTGIAEEKDGIVEIASTQWTNTKMEAAGGADMPQFSASIPEISGEGLYVKILGDSPTPADNFRAGLSIAKKSTSGPITISAAGQTVTSDGFDMTWDGDPVTGAGKTTGIVKNITLPESVLAMMDPSGTMKNLGYSSISFDIGGSGEVMNDGTNFGMDVDGYYDVKDMAALKIGMNATNIPLTLMEELKKQPQPDEAAVMSMSQGVTFGRFVIRLEDKSITKKILPMLAAMQGMDEATMVANAGAMVQLGMSQLQMPELTAQVAAAVNAYLADPKSLTISMKPEAPVTVGQLMTINPGDPASAVKLLGVTVTAND